MFQIDDIGANAVLNAMEVTFGVAPTMTIRSGIMPANANAAAVGTVLATLILPSDWMANASGRLKLLSGVWSALSANATGRASYYRIVGAMTAQGYCSDPHQFNKYFSVGDQVHNGTNMYRATVAGTTGAASAPVHTSGTAADGGVTWQWLQGSTDMTLDNASLNITQGFTVAGYQWSAPL